MISVLVSILILACVAGLIWWAISQIPLPGPLGAMLRVVVVLIFALTLLGMLFGSVPIPTLRF